MKKSLLALAVLGAFAGVASAQSSVTLYGTIDVGARYVKNDGSSRRLSLSTDGLNTSQLGFKGTEDLGGGLKAGFVLLSAIEADTGGAGAGAGSQFYNRRSTVSLWGNFGEIRLGRDYTPTGLNSYAFDVFGTNGVADATGIKQMAAPDYLRANNAIQYLLPTNAGGIYGGFMAAAGEGTGSTAATAAGNNQNGGGRYLGGRLGFAAGPFDVAAAYSDERLNANNRYKTASIGGSFDFSVAKIMGYFQQEKADSTLGTTLPVLTTATTGTFTPVGIVPAVALPRTNPKDNIYAISASIPVGQGEIHVGGSHSKFTADGIPSTSVTKFGAGYVYNLSKRTAVYGTVAHLKNGNNSTLSVGSDTGGVLSSTSTNATQNSGGITAPTTPGGKSNGAEIGIRHFF